MRLEHQVGIVTGAGQGIGRGIALHPAAEDARVALADSGGPGIRESAGGVAGADASTPRSP